MKNKLGPRILECAALFLAMPLGVALLPDRFPKLPLLVVFTVFCFVLLLRDPGFDNKQLWQTKGLQALLPGLVKRSVVVAAALSGLVLLFWPEWFLVLPRERFWLWVLIMCLYPLVSAYPQEVIYRGLFFHRYGRIFRSERLTILASGLAFSLLHVVYDNLPALVLTFIGGLAFSFTYARTKSILLAGLEHAIYGCLVFTTGLGRFFYEGGVHISS